MSAADNKPQEGVSRELQIAALFGRIDAILNDVTNAEKKREHERILQRMIDKRIIEPVIFA